MISPGRNTTLATLDAGLAATGKPKLALKGKAVKSLAAGKYKLVVTRLVEEGRGHASALRVEGEDADRRRVRRQEVGRRHARRRPVEALRLRASGERDHLPRRLEPPDTSSCIAATMPACSGSSPCCSQRPSCSRCRRAAAAASSSAGDAPEAKTVGVDAYASSVCSALTHWLDNLQNASAVFANSTNDETDLDQGALHVRHVLRRRDRRDRPHGRGGPGHRAARPRRTATSCPPRCSASWRPSSRSWSRRRAGRSSCPSTSRRSSRSSRRRSAPASASRRRRSRRSSTCSRSASRRRSWRRPRTPTRTAARSRS